MVEPISLESRRRAAAALATEASAEDAVCIQIPFRRDPSAELQAILQRAHLTVEARWIWIAQPTLKVAAVNAISLLSLAWPDPNEPSASACANGIELAVRSLLRNREEGERGRTEEIGRFLVGLASVAGAVARTTATGVLKDCPLAQYDHNRWNFVEWAHAGGFDAINFTFRGAVPDVDCRGVETVFISEIAASTHDVGCYLRHRA